MDAQLDYLFIDEAGQVSLADAVAMGTAARNLVLLGDPQQLPQVRQGIHPGESGCSVLEHLLAGTSTVPEDRGVFLAHTWRMHPDVCSFVSSLSYDGRLVSAERPRASADHVVRSRRRWPALPSGRTRRQRAGIDGGSQTPSPLRSALLLSGGTFTDHRGPGQAAHRARHPRGGAIQHAGAAVFAKCCPPVSRSGPSTSSRGAKRRSCSSRWPHRAARTCQGGWSFCSAAIGSTSRSRERERWPCVVCSPHLLDVRCRSVEQMRLVNSLCRFVENASTRDTFALQ